MPRERISQFHGKDMPHLILRARCSEIALALHRSAAFSSHVDGVLILAWLGELAPSVFLLGSPWPDSSKGYDSSTGLCSPWMARANEGSCVIFLAQNLNWCGGEDLSRWSRPGQEGRSRCLDRLLS